MHEHDDNDDEMKGRILGRREILGLFGGAGAALLVACSSDGSSDGGSSGSGGAVATQPATEATAATGSGTPAAASPQVPSCVVVPELAEGPYFVDENLDRSDIRSDPTNGTIKPGNQFNLTFNVAKVTAGACTVYPNAKVDIWHCDAQGAYSDVSDAMVGSTRGQKFLRGHQMTDANGKASFTTIYPGWYPGRAVHIHFKIRVDNEEFTSQLFFDETLSDQIFTQAAYQKSGNRTRNSNDSIYRQAGDVLLLQLTRNGDVYNGSFNIGLRA
jgi:protocatechuate 3,4-dioxygenase beta subunit